MIKVDKDIPIPVVSARTTIGLNAHLRALKNVGDSVFIAGANIKSVSAVANHCGLTGKYVSRSVEGGVRVWRTKE